MIDVNALIGPYPFRHVPHPDPDVLVRVLDREGIASAWVGHLPSAFYRDPTAGNRELATRLAPHAERLRAVPTIRPDWPRWDRAVDEAAAVRRAGGSRVSAAVGHGSARRERCESSRWPRESREWRSSSRFDSRISDSVIRWTRRAT